MSSKVVTNLLKIYFVWYGYGRCGRGVGGDVGGGVGGGNKKGICDNFKTAPRNKKKLAKLPKFSQSYTSVFGLRD